MNESIAKELRRILRSIAPETDPAALPPDVDIREELDIDSMDFLRYATAVSEHFGLDVPEADYPELCTLGGATRYVARHAGGP